MPSPRFYSPYVVVFLKAAERHGCLLSLPILHRCLLGLPILLGRLNSLFNNFLIAQLQELRIGWKDYQTSFGGTVNLKIRQILSFFQ